MKNMRMILHHPLTTASVTTKTNGIISENGHEKSGHDQLPSRLKDDDDVFLDNDHDECDNVVNIHQQQQYYPRCLYHDDDGHYDPLSPPPPPTASASSYGWFPCHCLVQRVMTGSYCTTQQRQQLLLLLKPLWMAQVLSFLLASSGAANASLHFECNVSAPILQAGMVYLGLVIYSLVVRGVCCLSGWRDSQEEGEEIMIMEGQQQQQQLELESMEMAVTSCNTPLDKDSIAITTTTTTTTTTTASVDYITSTTTTTTATGNTLEEQQQQQSPHPQAQCGTTMSKTKSCCLSQIFKVQYASLKLYAFMAFLDVEANYLIYLSFRYTTLTSVSLLDALAIPSAMVFSKLILRRKYYPAHVIGAAVCIVGMAVNVFGDYNKDDAKDTSGSSGNDEDDDGLLLGVEDDVYPHKLRGDIFAMGGAVLYGLNNVLTERVVKGANHVHEYLGVLGCFGTMYCAVQSLFLREIDALSFYFGHSSTTNDVDDHDGTGQCHPSEMWMLWFGSATLGVLSYTGMAHFLAESEAALLNLSLLTGDLWAALFIVVVERILPTVHFWMSLVLIVMGVCVYEFAAPSPMEETSLEPL